MGKEIDFATIAEPVARALLGEPNKSLSKVGELRFGTNGSVKIVTAGDAAGTYVDFETSNGGGLLDFICSQRGGSHGDALTWLQAEGFISSQAREQPQRIHDRIRAVYEYQDENGSPSFEVVRLENPKDFRQRRNERDWSVRGCKPVPYRLPHLLRGIRDECTVFVVEGEKDVERLADHEVIATTNAGGAGKWKDDFAAYFVGADVCVIADNDKAGREHAEKVARSLKGTAARIRIINLPDLPEKGDVSDWLDAGNDIHAFWHEVENAPDWRPQSRLGLTFFGDEDKFAPRKWLVKGVLGQGEMSCIYAPSGGGKSFFALDLAARIAAGLDWFGHQVTPSGVLYVCGEGASGFRNRMKAWRLAHEAGLLPFAMLARSLDLVTKPGVEEASEIVSEAMEVIEAASGVPVRLIVLDTASRMMPGAVDSEPKDMKAFLDGVETLREETGAHVLIIHHSGKDKDRGMRGSSMLRDYSDCVIEITPGDASPSVATIEKMKDGEDGAKYRFTLQQTAIGHDNDGDEITSCVVIDDGKSEGTEPAKAKRLPDDLENARRVLADLLSDDSVTTVTASVTGMSRAGVRCVPLEQWKDACRNRSILDDGDKGRQQWKRLKDKGLRLNVIGIQGDLVWLA